MPSCCFTVTADKFEKRDDGKFRLIVNLSTVHSSKTLDQEAFSCIAKWLGDYNVSCGTNNSMQKEEFDSVAQQVLESFKTGQINEIIVTISKYFGQNNYSLKDLFKDDQRYLLNYIVTHGLKKANELYDINHGDNSAILRFMKEKLIPPPKTLQSASQIVLYMEMEQLLSSQKLDLKKLKKLIADSKNFSVMLDSKLFGFEANEKITDEFNKLSELLENIETLLSISFIKIVKELPIQLNLLQPQNRAFKIAENQCKQ